MKKIGLLVAAFVLFLVPTAHALTWTDLTGQTYIDCPNWGLFQIETNGKVQITMTNPTAGYRIAGILVWEDLPNIGFHRTGNIKLDGDLKVQQGWNSLFNRIVPTSYTNWSTGTATLDGHNRLVVYGAIEGIQLKGNFSYVSATQACSSPIADVLPL